jgi:hypothetical protein
MRSVASITFFLTLLALPSSQFAQSEPPLSPLPDDKPPLVRLPNGRTQRDAILKADHAHNIEDVNEIIRLAGDLKTDFEKNTEYVLSVQDMKKLDDIEKLTRRIRARMKRF